MNLLKDNNGKPRAVGIENPGLMIKSPDHLLLKPIVLKLTTCIKDD